MSGTDHVSPKLFNTPTRFIARKGSNLQPTAESLKGKSVGIERGTIQETYAKTYWAPKDVQVVRYQNQDGVSQDLMFGRLDAALPDAMQANLGFLQMPCGANFQ